MRLLNIVDSETIHKRRSGIRNQDVYAVYGDWLFISFWLIQSHPKARATSPHSLDKYSQIFAIILVQYLLNLVSCHVGDL